MASDTVILTGAGGGIGRALASRLAADGYRLAVTDLSADTAQEIAEALPGKGHKGYRLDVGVEGEVEALFDTLEAQRPVGGVVAAAGLLILDENGQRRPLAEISLDEWSQTQQVNSTGTFLLLRAFLRRRRQRPVEAGRFVAFSSVAAQLGGYRSSSAYIASKSAVLGLVKAAAREGAAHGVSVNAVAPGLIDAPMLRLSLDPEADVEAAKGIPAGRIGTPEDVAGAVAFLLGPDASYLTGSVIDVNGGYRMQ